MVEPLLEIQRFKEEKKKSLLEEGLLEGKGWHYFFMEESPGFIKIEMSPNFSI